MTDLQTKLHALAQILEGRVVSDKVATPICIKGIISGFPITLQAIQSVYPFGLSYFLETGRFSKGTDSSFKLTILPKYARGFVSRITRFLFFERKGQEIGLPILDARFSFKCDNLSGTKQFLHLPSVREDILQLQELSNFSEMIVKSDAGLYLSQPISFNEITLENCQAIFQTMGALGQILFQAY